ncbi:hypothetical protein NDK50_34960 [Paraburkholderia bryophila]|uniref:acyl-CoA thioesterase n=1 Tax=Paraburkholderia bryophila TaxID=420952 RepID=UPI0023499BB1|nr:thioesterase family protein [Paraburkholderia bryophila]WCM23153.1 hypothetical protein NDK50_34960 [Paraburkholderia bryophila]
MTGEVIYERRLHHHETDSDGVCHFSNYFRIVEESFDQLTRSKLQPMEALPHAFAVVDTKCRYARPIRHGDMFKVRLEKLDVRRSFLDLGVAICVGEEVHAFAEARFAAVDKQTNRSLPIDSGFRTIIAE